MITKCMACGSTFKNVTINAEGVIIDSLFGGSQYAGYKTEKPCYFDNFVINADEVLELAHEKSADDDLKSISIYSVGGIKGNLNKTSDETSVVHLSNKCGYLTIDDEFVDAEIVSVTFDGKVITDFVRVNGMIKFVLSDLFTEGNFGIKEVEVNLITERGINVRLKHGVDVRSELVVVDFSTVQNIVLSNEKIALSLNDTEGDYSACTNVNSIMYGSYNFGTDLSALDVSAIAEIYELHGENKTLEVFASNGAKNVLIRIPVTIITKEIKTFDELMQSVTARNNEVEKSGAYYTLGNDIDAEEKTIYTFLGENGSTITPEYCDLGKGFAGTLNGKGYKVYNLNLDSSGIFRGMKDATVKNISFEIANYSEKTQGATLFASNVQDCLFEKVTVTVTKAINMETNNNTGLLVVQQTKGTTFQSVNIIADDSTLTTLVGSGYWSGTAGNNKYENCAVSCLKLNYVGYTIATIDGMDVNTTKTITLTNNQDILLTNETYAISLGSEGTGLTINSITCNGVDLGTNLSNLDMSAIKNDMTKHGITNVIVKGEKDGNKVTVIAPVTIITKSLTSGAEFKEATYCANSSEGEKNKGAYYILVHNLNVSDTSFTASDDDWIDLGKAGFAGTIDGRGKKLVGVNLTYSLGIFRSLKNATIKNLEIEIASLNVGSAFASVFACYADNTVFEDISITLTMPIVTTNCGLLGGGNQSMNCTFKNITVNAQGSEICRLFSGGDIVKNSKNNISGITVSAKSVQYMYATTDLETSGFDVTVNLDENQ